MWQDIPWLTSFTNKKILILLLVLLIILLNNRYYDYHNNIGNHVIPADVETVLDLGCGDACRKLPGKRIIYMDVVNAGKCNRPIIYNGETIPLPDKSIDLVIISFVFHHIPPKKQEKLLQEINRVSRKYVLVIEDTPRNSLQQWFNKIHINCGRWGGDSHGSGFYTKEEWFHKLGKFGHVLCEPVYLAPFMRDFPFFYWCDRHLFLLTKM